MPTTTLQSTQNQGKPLNQSHILHFSSIVQYLVVFQQMFLSVTIEVGMNIFKGEFLSSFGFYRLGFPGQRERCCIVPKSLEGVSPGVRLELVPHLHLLPAGLLWGRGNPAAGMWSDLARLQPLLLRRFQAPKSGVSETLSPKQPFI